MRDRERPQPARAVDRRLDTPAGGEDLGSEHVHSPVDTS